MPINQRSVSSLISITLAFAFTAGCAGDNMSSELGTTSQPLEPQDEQAVERYRGQTDFVSTRPGGYWGGPMFSAKSAAEGATNDATREVVESDVYRLAGHHLYILNQYRGLQVVDVTQQDDPKLLGRAEMFGEPYEMYIDTTRNRAYVLVQNTTKLDEKKIQRNSRVVTVDLTDKSDPKILGSLDLVGNIVESRQVGNVLYVVSTEQPSYWHFAGDSAGGEHNGPRTTVKSINVGSSAVPFEVANLELEGNSYEIHASSESLFVAKPGESYSDTLIDVIDISDPNGAIVRGRTLAVPGRLQDRYHLSEHNGVLRTVTHDWNDSGTIFVNTYSIEPGGTASKLGNLVLPQIGTLLATKFDGEKAYLVHQVRIDPIDVIDLSDPAVPVRLSSLEIPGWLEDLEIRGDRVVGIGMDTVGDRNQLAVAMYDVADPTNTSEISRVHLGDGSSYQWTNFWDKRTFRLLDDQGLLLVPFSSYETSGYIEAVHLVDVDLKNDALGVRGRIRQAGTPVRSFEVDQRIGSFSDRELTVANIDDRDHPFVADRVELARNIAGFTKLNNAGLQFIHDWERGSELRAVPLSDSDASVEAALSVLPIKEASHVIGAGDKAIVVGFGPNESGAYLMRLTLVDYTNPRRPLVGNTLEFDYAGLLYGLGGFNAVTEAPLLQVTHNLYAIGRQIGEGITFDLVKIQGNRLIAGDSLQVDSQGEFVNLRVVGDDVYLTEFKPIKVDLPEDPQPIEEVIIEPLDGEGEALEAPSARMIRPPWFHNSVQLGRHYVTRIDVSPFGLAASNPLNTPGQFVSVNDVGRMITLDSRPVRGQNDQEPWTSDVQLDTLYVDFDFGTPAYLLNSLDIADNVSKVLVRDNGVFFTSFKTTEPTEPTGDAPMFFRRPWYQPSGDWKMHVVRLRNWDLRQTNEFTVQTNGVGDLIDVERVGNRRFGFVTYGGGSGLGVLDLTSWTEEGDAHFVPANGWFNDLTIDMRNHEVNVWSWLHGVHSVFLP